MDIKNFNLALDQIAEEKGISTEQVKESIETAIAAAYKKDYGQKGQNIRCKLDFKTGEFKFWQVKTVVSEDMVYKEDEEKDEEKVRFNPERHIMLEEVKKDNPGIEEGEEIETELESKEDYRRIAAQTAKQVILQKIREAERNTIFQEYKRKEGEIVSGALQRIEHNHIYVDLGKTFAILPKEEQVYGEFYKPGQRLKFFLLKVEEGSKGPNIVLSRAHPKLVSKLFELEVPEIGQEIVEIKAIARAPGAKTKIAVSSSDENIDPIGSAVGQKGTRVSAVIRELGGEKIDIVEYSENPEEFIANSLSPAKVLEVKISSDNKAVCLLPKDQLSLAIGRDGQNVRLAAKLTGWNIDVQEVESGEEEDEEIEEKTEEKESKKDASEEADQKEEKNKEDVDEKVDQKKEEETEEDADEKVDQKKEK